MTTRMRPPSGEITISLGEIEYMRNGSSGAGFFAVRFLGATQGKKPTTPMFAVVFDAPEHVAVFELNPDGSLYPLPINKWRAESFEGPLRRAIAESQRAA